MAQLVTALRTLVPAVCAVLVLALAADSAVPRPPAGPAVAAETHRHPMAAERESCEGNAAPALPHAKTRRSGRPDPDGPPTVRAVDAGRRPADTAPAAPFATGRQAAAPSGSGELPVRLQVFRC